MALQNCPGRGEDISVMENPAVRQSGVSAISCSHGPNCTLRQTTPALVLPHPLVSSPPLIMSAGCLNALFKIITSMHQKLKA